MVSFALTVDEMVPMSVVPEVFTFLAITLMPSSLVKEEIRVASPCDSVPSVFQKASFLLTSPMLNQ